MQFWKVTHGLPQRYRFFLFWMEQQRRGSKKCWFYSLHYFSIFEALCGMYVLYVWGSSTKDNSENSPATMHTTPDNTQNMQKRFKTWGHVVWRKNKIDKLIHNVLKYFSIICAFWASIDVRFSVCPKHIKMFKESLFCCRKCLMPFNLKYSICQREWKCFSKLDPNFAELVMVFGINLAEFSASLIYTWSSNADVINYNVELQYRSINKEFHLATDTSSFPKDINLCTYLGYFEIDKRNLG